MGGVFYNTTQHFLEGKEGGVVGNCTYINIRPLLHNLLAVSFLLTFKLLS